MLDPKKLLEHLPRPDRARPFRYLGRRVVQAMVDASDANLLLGQRRAPGRFLVARLVASDEEKELWERQFTESRSVLLREIEREATVREIQPRSALGLELVVVTEAEVAAGDAAPLLAAMLDPADVPALLERLAAEQEVISARRARTLVVESEPPEAQVYLDHRPLGVTPLRVEELAEGDHLLTLVRPGFLPHEETVRVEARAGGRQLRHHVVLAPEPPMGALEVVSFPPHARVTIGGETRDAPARWRLPCGPVEARVELPDYTPRFVTLDLPPAPEERPHRLQLKLEYCGEDRDEVVGRLVVYRPDGRRPAEPAATNRISSFFAERELELTAPPPESPPAEVLGERPLRRGIILIGREDPGGDLTPDLRLFDAENSVSRGCHAWIWVYADTSTGATYNTFLLGNNSPAGVRVDGALVMETRRLAEDSVIEIGSFRLRLVKESPAPRVEFGF